MMRCEPLLRSKKPEQLGMTLPEMIVAMAMLVVFTAVVVLVMQFTLRFFTDSESGEQNEFEVSNGVLIDHLEIQMAMDRLVEVLSQPGVAVENIALTLNDPALDLAQDCASNPVSSWGLPMSEVVLPSGYRMCLWKTSETELQSIANNGLTVKPGIYLLQALPERLNPANLPARRLFCRPRPFC